MTLPRWILAALLLSLVLAGCADTEDADQPPAPSTTLPAECPLGPERCPDPYLTPGAVDPDAGKLDPDRPNVPLACDPGGVGRDPHRQLAPAQERAVLAAYHLPAGTKPAEFDHRVAWWAGGLSSSMNVWPELNAGDKARKDRLEESLYRQVCVQHTMGLATAQQRMREFWVWWG
jgi:hypothetical protein